MSTKKTTFITDLDNTLFDWVDLWVNCFSAMLDGIAEVSGIQKELLIPEIKKVHQKHGTSEYSFLIEELPILSDFLDGRAATDVFAEPIDAYRQQRRQHLKLYPGVGETLLKIKGHGVKMVGYTESMAFYSNYRIRRLGLDGVLDYVFCPSDHMIPEGLSKSDIRKYPAAHYEFKYTKQHFTPAGSKKPDALVLKSIIKDLGAREEECIYVGDSLMKDIAMAADCGIDNAWAKYGQAHKRAEYKLLQDVTHWTAEEVAREQKIRERKHVNPQYTLENSLADILENVEFRNFRT